MTKVVGIHGYKPTFKEPNPKVIELLEDLLEQARSGEIIGLSGALLYHDKLSGTVYGGIVGTYGMVGALDVMKSELKKLCEE